jgi:hypothetical protein
MSVDITEEFVAIDGIVASGVYGTAAAPVDASGALGGTWTDHGLTTDAGVTRSQPVSQTMRRAWQNNKKLRTLTTEAAVRFQFVLVQTDEANVALFHGVALSSGSLITDPSREFPKIAFDLDMVDGSNVIREYAPSARVIEVGDQVAVAGGGLGWPITLEAEYDDGIAGYTKQFYSEFEGATPISTVTAATPSAAAEDAIVKITGTSFTGATVVKFGATNATAFVIDDSTTIYATVPAGSAGSAAITVTTPAGVSSAFAYTRGA